MKPVSQLALIGGHIALDFVNTAEERGHPAAGEALHGPDDLRRWGERTGLLADGVAEDPAEFRRARAARELMYAILRGRAPGGTPAGVGGTPGGAGGTPAGSGTACAGPDPDANAALAALVAEAHAAGTLADTADGRMQWRWDPHQLATVRHVAVTALVELLSHDPPARIKQCPGDHCGWFFLDTTKRGNRRWCEMGECGQDAKTARRRARRAAGGGATA